MDEWMDGWMDGWMDVWMDGWMDGWMSYLGWPHAGGRYARGRDGGAARHQATRGARGGDACITATPPSAYTHTPPQQKPGWPHPHGRSENYPRENCPWPMADFGR